MKRSLDAVDPSTAPTATASTQSARQARTTVNAARHGQPWTPAEDAELATYCSDDDLEVFALRWGRRFLSVEQRRRRPRPSPDRVPTGTGWVR